MSQLRERLAQLDDLRKASAVLDWDQHTMMPPAGARSRADTIATLARLSHEMFVSAETGRLLEAAAGSLNGAPRDSDDARLIDVTRRRWEKTRRVPAELAEQIAHAASIGQDAWALARERDDFASFKPYLERNYELTRRYIDCFEGFDCAYDVVLDDYEPRMKSAQVARLFEALKAELVPLIATVSRIDVDDSCLHGSFPIAQQRRLVEEVVAMMGFDPTGWRIDDTVHPFATSFGSSDVRITNRWDEGFLSMGLYGAMHECGHGLYEAGIADSLQRTPLARLDSLALHESQSRLWENMVGRSRTFCGVLAPRIAQLFGGSLSGLHADTLFRAVNRVSPSLIRVEADEATYGLHVIVRFELEQELVEGRLAVSDLPEAWNARYKDYLGLDVASDTEGVLQDVHWSAGYIGYFPTYALGNLVAAQLWRRLRGELPDLDAQIAAGQLSGLRGWLRDNVHRHGAKFTATELLERVAGEPIEVEPFVTYLKDKLSNVYQASL